MEKLEDLVMNDDDRVIHDLFASVFSVTTEKKDDLSNLLTLWDQLPIYCISRQRQNKLRDPVTNQLLSFEVGFRSYSGEDCSLKISPAQIEENGITKSYYPSESEEIISYVLRKIFMYQKHGVHLKGKDTSWCRFSLTMLKNELKKWGKSKSLKEIALSLEIMRKCEINVSINKKQTYLGSILPESVLVNRQSYISDPNTLSAVRFSSLISSEIDNFEYRQINHVNLMTLKGQVARWIYKRLSANFINAGFDAPPYSLNFSTIEKNSHLLHHQSKARRVVYVREALDKIVNDGLILKYEERKGSDDIEFQIHANLAFTKEMRAANARKKDAKTKLKLGYKLNSIKKLPR